MQDNTRKQLKNKYFIPNSIKNTWNKFNKVQNVFENYKTFLFFYFLKFILIGG